MKPLRYFNGLLLGMVMVTGTAWGQSFPDKSKPLRIMVPSGAASTGDLMARAYARAITEVSGMSVVVDNRPGAEGVIGLQAVKAAPPDGYTIMMTSNSTQVLNGYMLPSISYDPVADFVPLVGAGTAPLAMYVGVAAPFKTPREFFAAAKAHPGKYSYASSTTIGRAAGEMLEQMAGVKMLAVPYKTMSEVMTGVSSGEVDVGFSTVSTADAFVKSGRIRPLATTGTSRLGTLPNVATLKEEGLAEYELTSWLATYAPAHTPSAVVAVLRDILQKAGKTAFVVDVQKTFALEPLNMVGDELTALQRTDSAKLGKVIGGANARKP